MPTQFTLDDLPDVTFTVERGTQGEAGLPSNWVTITGTREIVPEPTDDIPDPTPVVETVCQVGFAGP